MASSFTPASMTALSSSASSSLPSPLPSSSGRTAKAGNSATSAPSTRMQPADEVPCLLRSNQMRAPLLLAATLKCSRIVRPAAVLYVDVAGYPLVQVTQAHLRLFRASFQVDFRLVLTCCNNTVSKPEHSRMKARKVQQVPAQSLALQQCRQQVLPSPAVMQRAHGLMEQVAQRIQRFPQGFPSALSICGGMSAAVLYAQDS